MSLTNLGSREPRDRADVVRRGRAGAAGGRRGAPGLLQAVRPDRVRRRARRAAGDAPAAVARRARGLGGAPGRRRGRDASASCEFETDRARFLGRGREIRDAARGDRRPAALQHRRHGARSDLQPAPPRARRRRAPPRASRSRRWSRRRASEVLDLADKYHDADDVRARRHAGLDPGAGPAAPSRHRRPTRRTSSSASPATCSTPTRRCGRRPTRSAAAAAGPPTLWAHGISGDLPIVLVRIDDVEDLAIVRQLLRAHEYWRLKQLAVDLVILNERGAVLRAGPAGRRWRRWCARASRGPARRTRARAGGVFVLRSRPDLGRDARRCCRPRRARCCSSRRGRLAEQLDACAATATPAPRRQPRRPRRRRGRRRRRRRGRPRVLQRPRRLRRPTAAST